MKTVNFELSSTLKYANNTGAEIECSHIELREPTGKVSHLCAQIESLIQSGVINMSKNLSEDVIESAKEEAEEKKSEKDEDEDKIADPESMLSVMTSSGIDMNKVVLNFRELFKEVAFMGGEKAITVPRLNDMSHKDFRKMMGVYAVNFIMN